MSNISVIDAGGRAEPVREGESPAKAKLISEAELCKRLDRIAPDWPLHLHDSWVIDHILKVVNNPRASRAEITRRYRARRGADDLGFRGGPLRAVGRH